MNELILLNKILYQVKKKNSESLPALRIFKSYPDNLPKFIINLR